MLDKDVLAENLFRCYTVDEMHWRDQSEEEKSRWLAVAEYVLDREAQLTYVSYHKRAVKRQLERIKERIECSKTRRNGMSYEEKG